MIHYLLRKKNNVDIELSKFEDDKEPLDVYTVTSRGCSCPAAWRRKTCKHTRMVKFWSDKLNSEVGAVLGFDESDYPYKVTNIFGKKNPLNFVEKVEEWLDQKKKFYV